MTARVELLDYASDQDYQRLHAAMESEGYSRIVLADDQRRYHLPPAEYVHTNVKNTPDGLERANRAAAATRKPYRAFVAGWDGSWSSHNLASA